MSEFQITVFIRLWCTVLAEFVDYPVVCINCTVQMRLDRSFLSIECPLELLPDSNLSSSSTCSRISVVIFTRTGDEFLRRPWKYERSDHGELYKTHPTSRLTDLRMVGWQWGSDTGM